MKLLDDLRAGLDDHVFHDVELVGSDGITVCANKMVRIYNERSKAYSIRLFRFGVLLGPHFSVEYIVSN